MEAIFRLKWELSPDNGPLSRQLADHIRKCVCSGEISARDKIPSSRSLSSELEIARGTVTTAIDMLIAEGVLEARAGSGTFVAEDASVLRVPIPARSYDNMPLPEAVPLPDVDEASSGVIDLRPCRPSLEAFPVKAWRRCMSEVAGRVPESDYGDPRGEAELRQEICRYLRRARGLSVSSDEIIVTNGAVHAMHILSAVYLKNSDKVVFENPGYPLARQMFALAGAQVIPCGVDANGLIVEELPRSGKNVKFVYITPSHQFPTGGRLSLGRRRALIEWAAKHGALIVEDDYDGEFRYDVPPLAPLAAMSHGSVVYFGTFSKTMFPGLRIGFAVAPRPIIDAMSAFRTISEYAPATPNQRALARFIAEGDYEKHVLRMRRLYSAKRRVLFQRTRDAEIPASLDGLDSGLSVLLKIESRYAAREVSRNALRTGVLIPPVTRYDVTGSLDDDALVFGYAAPSVDEIEAGLRQLIALSK